MQKNFDEWNVKKQETENVQKRLFFHEREIWWCKLGENIGFEQDGKGKSFSRPVVVYKKFNNEICLVLPLTTKNKNGKYYLPVMCKDGSTRSVILSQIRLIDSKRFLEKVETLPVDTFKAITKAVIDILR